MKTNWLLTSVGVAGIGWFFLNPQGNLTPQGDLTPQADRSATQPGDASPEDSSVDGSGPPVDRAATGTPPADVDNHVTQILREAAAAEDPAKAEPDVVYSEGPWGSLQSYNVYISAPDHIIDLFRVPSSITAWNFFDLNEQDVAALFDRPDIPAEVRSELTDRSRWTVAAGQIQVTPSNESILAIPPAARAAIYAVLSKWELNEFVNAPYFVPDGNVDAWLSDTDLRPALIDIVRRTTYPSGRMFCFSDVSLVVGLTKSHSEARAVLKALSRTRTAILRLRLGSESDVRKIAAYWSAGSANAKDFLPLLESVKSNPLVEHLDIIHVLPPYARKLMYTYPHPSLAIGGRYPDCHWTSLNFFNYRPEGRVFDVDGATMFVLENFEPGAPPYRYGDVLFFTDSQGRAIHSCIHLADDFVFTKNGANLICPWLIMKLQDVLDRYSVSGPPMVQIYRKVR